MKEISDRAIVAISWHFVVPAAWTIDLLSYPIFTQILDFCGPLV
jgi:hypothetical protein